MYKCCLFDLDGTLLNTVHALTRTMNLTLAEFGLEPVTEEETKVFVGDGYRNFVKRAFLSRRNGEPDAGGGAAAVLSAAGSAAGDVPEEAYPVYLRHFQANCLYRVDAYDGIRELLAELKRRHVKLAVVSNKGQEQAAENIEYVFGRGYFDLILGEREGIPRKPDPAGPLYAARVLGAAPRECLYLGDTNTDMRTGAAAGMDTAGVTWGFRSREELAAFHPRYIIDHPLEILPLIS